ncbi:hypothetical protein HPP92_010094 [Vanilla planifolia]|uniref:Uncharacterized protein n=1 Tax=Vanilla planifolia TaxID=51239 RepID=A0A835R5S2_VANPL|nr:hypothetical protein HPP92_010094 [Vanilla planifolia]
MTGTRRGFKGRSASAARFGSLYSEGWGAIPWRRGRIITSEERGKAECRAEMLKGEG